MDRQAIIDEFRTFLGYLHQRADERGDTESPFHVILDNDMLRILDQVDVLLVKNEP